MKLPIEASKFCSALQSVGLVPEGYVRSVTIYARAGDMVEIDINMDGDERLYGLVPQLTKVRDLLEQA